MNKLTIKKDGRKTGEILAPDAREAGAMAIYKWGPGTYDISLVRDDLDDRDDADLEDWLETGAR
jgi:hypothetical protein